ncbi:(2Fe-2S)-binding protein [Actinocrispum sp. NPDC049592]|uniref:(2Fe-2S)-binding protein n=1 Tax=Actinocrispum sp. NPDC049592 TaxID=3154835 RepID=UPI00341254BF
MADGLSRRQLFGRAAVVSAGVALAAPATAEAAADDGTVEVSFVLNGKPQTLTVDPRVTLLDALRERLHQTGTKKGCDRGQCGACTVHIDGRRVVSCLTLAVTVRGKQVTTIEGLAEGETLHPVQEAFIACDAFQCGFCTSGQIMSAAAVIAEGRARTDAEISEAMSGNICRCGAYPNIVAAIRQAGGA